MSLCLFIGLEQIRYKSQDNDISVTNQITNLNMVHVLLNMLTNTLEYVFSLINIKILFFYYKYFLNLLLVFINITT